MNVFLPYSNNIKKSVQSLDNARLIKQIFEIKILLDDAIAYEKRETPSSYFRHPVTRFFKDKPLFLCNYGIECCLEYSYRYQKNHKYYSYFLCQKDQYYGANDFAGIAYYMEGSKTSPNCIRITDKNNVDRLFKAKLIYKWVNDKRPPSWGNREKPDFWQNFLALSESQKADFWKSIQEVKETITSE